MAQDKERVLDLRSVFGILAKVTTPDTVKNGEYVEMDCTLDSGGSTIIHTHPQQEESYQVLQGALEVFLDGHWRVVEAGESLTVPQGAVHGFRNTSGAPARFINVHRPALAFQENLEMLDRLIRAGKIRGMKDLRSLIYMSMASIKHSPSIAVKPPHWLVIGMAFVGRRLGYKLS